MGFYNFRKDFAAASAVEREAAAKIITSFPDVTDMTSYGGPEHDLECKVCGLRTTFEVKNELMVTKTGNVAIEFTCRGKPSGIRITTADFWVEKIRGAFYIIRTADLRAHIEANEFDDAKCGGDPGSMTCFYLVAERKFLGWCQPLEAMRSPTMAQGPATPA